MGSPPHFEIIVFPRHRARHIGYACRSGATHCDTSLALDIDVMLLSPLLWGHSRPVGTLRTVLYMLHETYLLHQHG